MVNSQVTQKLPDYSQHVMSNITQYNRKTQIKELLNYNTVNLSYRFLN